jgi:hypothetical protein
MKYHQTIIVIVVMTFAGIALAACNSGKKGSEQAIENYIQALSNKDLIQISNLSCGDWEQNAQVEVNSLTGVGAEVNNLACKETGQAGSDTLVSCTGVLALDYNGEAQQIDLSTRTYIARQEDGEWRMCGYH